MAAAAAAAVVVAAAAVDAALPGDSEGGLDDEASLARTGERDKGVKPSACVLPGCMAGELPTLGDRDFAMVDAMW